MDNDSQDNKASVLWYREHSDESTKKRSTDSTASPTQAQKRPIRRVRSPSRPRGWLPSSYKPKFGSQFYRPRFPRDNHLFHKAGFSNHRHHYYMNPRSHRRDHFQPKLHHIALREKERYEHRESTDGSSPPKQNNSTRPFLSRSTSSRDKDMQSTVCESDRNQSRERDRRRTKSRDGELPSTVSQTAARDRAIQQKRREIDEVYHQECEMFGFVVKMLIAKDSSLEGPIQSSLQQNLRDIGKRCVEAMEKFIEDYDSREPLH
ncbi:arginine/serine-rich coiled-coil protein 2 isoform X2 [Parambassis ranga]|uniref:Arginine/serine-rich coiled-coil protein 2 isoform X2 n=1 Tax=Parambassis ranga TaxID=210632 RepID=A0A6P7IDL8_9TELE|nr:arginine/serine-rich coiled-coil protein 2-like isoform X2 [Parambassis ranga]